MGAQPATWLACANIGLVFQLAGSCLHHHDSAVAGAAAHPLALGLAQQAGATTDLSRARRQSLPTPRAGRKPARGPCKPAGGCELAHLEPDPLRRSSFCRTVSNSTALRTLFVTRAMATCLGLPDDDEETHLAGDGLVQPTSKAAPLCTTSVLFRRTLTMRDSFGKVWRVMYEAILSSGQYHRRLTKGWREFCRFHGVKVGGSVEFRRGVAAGEGEGMLSVRVLKQGSRGG